MQVAGSQVVGGRGGGGRGVVRPPPPPGPPPQGQEVLEADLCLRSVVDAVRDGDHGNGGRTGPARPTNTQRLCTSWRRGGGGGGRGGGGGGEGEEGEEEEKDEEEEDKSNQQTNPLVLIWGQDAILFSLSLYYYNYIYSRM